PFSTKTSELTSLVLIVYPAVSRSPSAFLVENGGTIVIGGIFEQEELENTTRVPFLGDLPYVGFLFKTKQKSDRRIELLIMITPKIMDDAVALK
ncbi:MAG: type IV pilus secretin PilQ, partial [Gammaproteobacteria bacterium]|nr:type IV pilus secretin PilQ [Gammaproteobacteria bacterium]